MKTTFLPLLAFGYATLLSAVTNAQCVDENNVYPFTYNGNNYEVVLENKTWADAAACAVERGGYLIEINDSSEQAMLFANLPFINFNMTTAPDGGNGGYLWMGGNDLSTEGSWTWDGDNNGTGIPFWSGDVNGSPVGGMYTNWGNEPDDFGSGQDALGYAITNWPNGMQEQWNDLSASNSLYFIIEYTAAALEENPSSTESFITPNPANDVIRIPVAQTTSVQITNAQGAVLQTFKTPNDESLEIPVSDYETGVYFVRFTQEDGTMVQQRFLKL